MSHRCSSPAAHWDLPVDADEAPWTTAVREVREELGIDPPPGRLLVIDYLPRDDRMPEGLAFIFDGGTITDAQVDDLSLTDPENLSAGLFSLDEAVTKVKPSLTRRLAVALEVAQDGGRRRVVNSSLPRARRAGSLWCGARGRRSDSGSIAKPRH